MGCAHVHLGGACVTVCTSDMSHVFKTEVAGERWCFGCRKRLPHTWELRGAPPGVLTYYDPEWVCRCSSCGRDRTRFPG